MLYCDNPICSNPFNSDNNKFCQSCGSSTLTPLFRNRFQIIRLLGAGGFGRTYEAIDTDRMGDRCVIKQFFPQVQGTAALDKATELFKQEAKRLYELGEHPQIPRLIAYFEQDQRLYLVQELIEGENLLEELQQQGAFSEEKIRQLLADLLPVLKFVHDRAVIHRDIKPENIMRRRRDGKLILIDFGVSKEAVGTIFGQVGTTVGTPGYAPIEQMRGQVYPASDLYSLGVTCLRLLTQSFAQIDGSDDLYSAREGRWMWRDRLHYYGTTISPQLGEILDKLIQDYARDRFQGADEVLQALNSENSAPYDLISTTSTPIITTLPNDLSSSVGIDYTRLRDLLAEEKWKEADLETKDVMLKVAGRKSQGWLRREDLEKFPCTDLRTLNALWVNYSRGRFGFSIQNRIWKDIEKIKPNASFDDFCDRVGWRVNNSIKYENITFTLNAPLGHLPACILDRTGVSKIIFSVGIFFNVGINHTMAARLAECNIQ